MSVAEIWQNIQPQYLPSQSLGFSSIGDYDAPERVPEDCVRRSWILIKPGYEIIVRSTDIPRDLYKAPAQRCRRLFADLIHQWYHISVDEDEIQFFVPKAPLFSSHFGHPAWRMIPMGDLPSNPDFTQVPLDVSLSDALVVKPSVGTQGINIVVNVVFECSEFMRYRKTLMDPNLAPQPDKVAPTATEAIFDGRRASAAAHHAVIKADPDPPPIHLFNPVFDAFTHYLLNPDMQPTASDIQDVYELMCCLSVTTTGVGVGVDPDISFEREQDVQRRLAHILDIKISENPDSAGTGAGGIVVGQTPIPFLIFERTSELVDGDYDPTTQAGLIMGRSWTGADSIKARIRDDCCCPTFMITGGGPWLSIMGGIFTDRIIVQRLTELRWMALSSPDEDSSVYHNARLLVALRISLSWLAGYYTKRAELTSLHLRPYSPSRFFPCVSCFRVDDSGTNIVDFRYLRRLDQHTGFTYLAEMEDGPKAKLVVKFVKKYGKDVHEFLALHNHAPALLHCGQVSGSSTPGAIKFNSGLGRNAPPGLFLDEGMNMVVMEYIPSRPPLTLEDGKGSTGMDAQVLEQVHRILRLLHSNGFVFGELRPPNILVTETGIVKLIGFDWSGRFDMGVGRDPLESLPDGLQDEIEAAHLLRVDGAPETPYAYYPLGMSSVYGLWDPGMCPLKPIRPQHDWVMYSKLRSSEF